MKKFQKALAIAGVCIMAFSISGCFDTENNGGGDDNGEGGNNTPAITTPVSYEHEDYTSSTIEFSADDDKDNDSYDTSLYYRNNLDLDMGDPMLVYDEEHGYFYAYGTRGGTSFNTFRSTDLTNWTTVADCFKPEAGSWSVKDLWAPDIQKIGDKWYLYYTANYDYGGGTYNQGENCQIGVAVGNSPEGPFIQFEGKNANGETIGLDKPAFFWEGHTILDQHVFEDDNGDLYMYFSYDTKYSNAEEDAANGIYNNGTAEIFCVKMKDPVTWDFSTLTPCISAGYQKYQDKIDEKKAGANPGSYRKIDWETWSISFDEPMECVEGPYMIKNGGKYYLTYCANSFVDTNYAVGYAVSDSPMGPFVKPIDTAKGKESLKNMICGVPGQEGGYIANRYLGFTTGTGHASVCKVGKEYLLAYHAHMNRHAWGKLEDEYPGKSKWRALGYDYIQFYSDGSPYTNGPTYSLQKLPDVVTKYSNIALEARISAQGTNAKYLNDNYTNRACNNSVVNIEERKETTFEAGEKSIEIKFAQPMKIKALNIYNSCYYADVIKTIKQIDFGDGKGIVNIGFNERYIRDENVTDDKSTIIYYGKYVFPHAAFNIALKNEVTTDRIVITFESDKAFALGEIEILGK